MSYVTKDDLTIEMREKVAISVLDELKDKLGKVKANQELNEENIELRLASLKEEYENKTKELVDQIEDLNKKLDELEEDSYDDEYQDTDQDLESELGDTLDVNALNQDVELLGEAEEDADEGNKGEEE